MLLAAVSEAVERYDPSRGAAILLEVASGYQVLILTPEGVVRQRENVDFSEIYRRFSTPTTY